ncbi:MAG: M81 family metallopeptidase [Spirochaetaceae bacterium]|nr:M81 family metallopeptidase [Spirochaetaceae bacterium]
MKKRVLVGELHHESDTFNPIVTSKDDIWVYRGQNLIEHKDKSSISGAIKTLLDAGYEVVPTLIASAVPNGEWDKDYYLYHPKHYDDLYST